MSRRAWAAYRARELEATLFEANGGSDLGPLSAQLADRENKRRPRTILGRLYTLF